MSAIPRDSFLRKHVRGLARYELPLILLGRLAVDSVWQEQDWVRSYLEKPFGSASQFPCRWVAAVSSPMPVGIRCRGMRNTVLFRSNAKLRISQPNECSWIFGLSRQPLRVRYADRPGVKFPLPHKARVRIAPFRSPKLGNLTDPAHNSHTAVVRIQLSGSN
jgi:hypothetical protein